MGVGLSCADDDRPVISLTRHQGRAVAVTCAVFSPVHVAAMADFDDDDDKALSVHLVHNSIVLNPNATRSLFGSLKRLEPHWERIAGQAINSVRDEPG
jgi:hypothetical protein